MRARRSHRPFVVVDCSTLPDTLLRVRAVRPRAGRLHGGGGDPARAPGGGRRGHRPHRRDRRAVGRPPGQAPARAAGKGGAAGWATTNRSHIDVRVIAATHRDLRERSGRRHVSRGPVLPPQRGDHHHFPPLRERLDDLPLLARHFLDKHCPGRPARRCTGLAPRNACRPSAPTDGRATSASWSTRSNGRWRWRPRRCSCPTTCRLTCAVHLSPPGRCRRESMTLDELKDWYVETVLRQVHGNKVRAAEILGIDRRTLYRMLRRSASDSEHDGESTITLRRGEAPTTRSRQSPRRATHGMDRDDRRQDARARGQRNVAPLRSDARSSRCPGAGRPGDRLRGARPCHRAATWHLRLITGATVSLRVEREPGTRRSGSGVAIAVDRGRARTWIVTSRHLFERPDAGPVLVTGSRPDAAAGGARGGPEPRRRPGPPRGRGHRHSGRLAEAGGPAGRRGVGRGVSQRASAPPW